MRIIAYKDYLLYLFSFKKFETLAVIVDIGIVLISLAFLKEELLRFEHADAGLMAIVLLAIFAIVKFAFEAHKAIRALQNYFHVQNAVEKEKPVSFEKIELSRKERRLGYKKILIRTNKEECAIYSDAINTCLQISSPNIIIEDKTAHEIRKTIKKNFDILILFFNYYFFSSLRNKCVFKNGKKLCLSRDLEPHAKTVYLHKGYYFDSILTNELFAKYLENANDGMIVADALEYDPIDYGLDGSMQLRDISSSQMNNHFGASTLAFTNDHYLIVWKQNFTNLVSQDLLAPSGSGSSNWEDLAPTLTQTIVNNMERELAEECSLEHRALQGKINTKILGFYRWVNRGGLPQFAGVSRVDLPLADFEPNTKEVKKNHANARENMEYVHDIDDLPRAIAAIRKKGVLSVPLHMNLLFLEEYYDKQTKELEAWLFPHLPLTTKP